MKIIERLTQLTKRSLVNPLASNVSFLPITKSVHPVFRAHYEHLQNNTALPFPNKTFHVINRMPTKIRRIAKNIPYIAEVEGLFSILDKEITHSKRFDIKSAVKKIDDEIKNSNLRKIIFQSKTSFEMHQKWMSPPIENISTVVQTVPHRIIRRKNLTSNEIKIVITGTNIILKGLFLLEKIVPAVRSRRPDISFKCISSHPLPQLTTTNGIENIVISRMSDDLRDNIFGSSHYLLNLSIGDTLGTFLDSIEYNLPIIGFPGQHGTSYVPDGGGVLIKSPLFPYERIDWPRFWDVRSFPQYVIDQTKNGLFDSVVDEIVEQICALKTGFEYSQSCDILYEFSIRRLNIDLWLKEWMQLYSHV